MSVRGSSESSINVASAGLFDQTDDAPFGQNRHGIADDTHEPTGHAPRCPLVAAIDAQERPGIGHNDTDRESR